MQYYVAIDPDLGVDAEAFITAWQEMAEAQAVGRAVLAPQNSQYEMLMGAVMLDVAVNMVSDALYDLVKAVWTKARGKKGDVLPMPKKMLEVTKIEKPDGTKIIVMKRVEY